jgi:hypothetical protein
MTVLPSPLSKGRRTPVALDDFSLDIADGDGIADAERLRRAEHDTGENICKGALHGKADHDGDGTGRSQQAAYGQVDDEHQPGNQRAHERKCANDIAEQLFAKALGEHEGTHQGRRDLGELQPPHQLQHLGQEMTRGIVFPGRLVERHHAVSPQDVGQQDEQRYSDEGVLIPAAEAEKTPRQEVEREDTDAEQHRVIEEGHVFSPWASCAILSRNRA